MTATSTPAAELDEARRDALAERLFGALLSGAELLTVELGERLGLYATLKESGPLDAAGLAARTGVAERYAREWLEQQAVAGFIDVADDGDADSRMYSLSPAAAAVLTEPESAAHMMGAAKCLTGLALTLERVAQAYQTGDGVAYAEFGAEIREGIAEFNRPMFANDLPQWLETLPDVDARLARGGAVLDVGCGVGWSTVALARALPAAHVVGVDLDQASVDAARRNAANAGVDATFGVADAAGLLDGERFDLVCIFEALHDMADPVGALRRVRERLAPGGAVLVADERVSPTFAAPGGEVERLNYGWSTLHCLPATMHESTDVANGTVLREPTVRSWAAAAGYAAVDILPIDHDFWRFYRLRPEASSNGGGRR